MPYVFAPLRASLVVTIDFMPKATVTSVPKKSITLIRCQAYGLLTESEEEKLGDVIERSQRGKLLTA
jgi:hypothetical protein